MRHDEEPFTFIRSQEETMTHTTSIGLDISKNTFHVLALNCSGKEAFRKQLRRHQVLRFFAQLPPSLIGIETCGGAHYWARQLRALGHQVRLIPAQAVKALRRGQKNDYNDALAIAEALTRPQQRFVPIKAESDHDIQALQRLRRGYIAERTALTNRMRGLLLEYGIAIGKGLAPLRRRIPELLEDGEQPLSALVRSLLHQAWQHLHALDEQIKDCDRQVNAYARHHEAVQRLMQIPGFGPVLGTTWHARMGNCQQFRRGRDASAAAGLVPRQDTTGGKPKLLGITKRGDKELRSLLVHGARSVVSHAHKKDDALSRWICQLVARQGKNKATVALANKMARIAWAMTVHQSDYQPRMAS
jgi:transposase